MNKTLWILLLALSAVSFPAYSEDDSPNAVCTAEADDAGIEAGAEREAYIADCIQQVKQDMEESQGNPDAPIRVVED